MANPIGALRAELSASAATFEQDMGRARKALGDFGKGAEALERNLNKLTSVGYLLSDSVSRLRFMFVGFVWGAIAGGAAALTSELINQAKAWLMLGDNVEKYRSEIQKMQASKTAEYQIDTLKAQNISILDQIHAQEKFLAVMQQGEKEGVIYGSTQDQVRDRIDRLKESLYAVQQQLNKFTQFQQNITPSGKLQELLGKQIQENFKWFSQLKAAEQKSADEIIQLKKKNEEDYQIWMAKQKEDELSLIAKAIKAEEDHLIKLNEMITGFAALDVTIFPETVIDLTGPYYEWSTAIDEVSYSLMQQFKAQSLVNDITMAGQQALSAFILGQQKLGPAIRQAMAQVLAAKGAAAAVEALIETGKGFAALWFNPAEAASHFKAAAWLAAGAAAAGVAARGLAGGAFATGGPGGFASTPIGGEFVDRQQQLQPINVIIDIHGGDDDISNMVLNKLGARLRDNGGKAGPIQIEIRRP